MLDLNPNSPGFDAAMELLCLLPKAPIAVPIKLVAQDMNLWSVKRLIRKIESIGVRVNQVTRRWGESLAIDARDWRAAQRAATVYAERE